MDIDNCAQKHGLVVHCSPVLRFCLTCPGWPCRRTPQVEVHGRHEGHVAPVCQGCNDQAGAVAQVLVAVSNGGLQDTRAQHQG